MHKKGFTLIELLIVIGILGVLSAAVVLVLNPAELLKQARDSTRASDIANLNSALNLYLTDVANPLMDNGHGLCATTQYTAAAITTNSFSPARATASSTNSRLTDGTGWVPVNLRAISGGSPLGTLPVDPTNSGDLVYRYACTTATSTTFQLDALFESTKYNTTLNLPGKDGGPNTTYYEVGNAIGLGL